MEKYKTPEEVAKIYNCSAATIRRLCEQGKLDCIQIGTGKRKHYRILFTSSPVENGEDSFCPILESLGA